MSSSNRGRLAVAGCCVVATLAYSGAVTTSALATLVMPAVLVVVLVSMLARRMVSAGGTAVVATLLAIALAQIVNVASGEFNGPAARSTFIAGIATALAVTLADRWSPAWICVPVGAVLGGAMFLGAAGEVIPVVAIVVVLLTLTVPLLESGRQRRAGKARTTLLLPALAVVAGAVAFAAAHLVVAVQAHPPTVFAIAQVEPRIEPLHEDPTPSALPATEPNTADPSATDPSAADPSRADPLASGATRHGRNLVMTLIEAIAGLVLLLLLLRILLVAWAWRRVRRRLRRGTPAQAAVGAWSWALLRLRSYGVPLPMALSPDQVAVDASQLEVSEDVALPLQATARLAADGAFSPYPDLKITNDADAWLAADEVTALRRRELSRWRRALVAVRSVPAR